MDKKQIFGIALAIFPLSAFALKVMTLNLANYDGHLQWKHRLQLIVDSIAKADPDIIALQETRFDPDHPTSVNSSQDMAEQILYQLHLRKLYLQAQLVSQPAMYYPHDTDQVLGAHNYALSIRTATDGRTYYWEGLSVISRLPILETGSKFLSLPPACADDNKRITQYIKVTYKDKPLYIANIHFAYSDGCYAANIEETINYFKDIVKSNSLLMIGDFNMTPNREEFKNLKDFGLLDVWATLRPKEDGFTSTAEEPTKRIDYIWASKDLLPALKTPNQIEIVANKPDGKLYPSDHLGLTLQL